MEDPRPFGNHDLPGWVHLPNISPLLYVGNQRAPQQETFDVVVATVHTPHTNPRATTHNLHFDDQRGAETNAEVHVAKSRIRQGAKIVHDAVQNQKRVLVHCAWGQNRSCSICCAYAVLYLNWTADRAIQYCREANVAGRSYRGQKPPNGGAMHNLVFCTLVAELEKENMDETRNDESSPIRAMTQV